MEEQGGSSSSSSSKHSNNNNNGNGYGYVDTAKAERAVWLLKCPALVSRSFRSPPSDDPIAKVVLSIDPLSSTHHDSPQFTMELAGTEAGHIPKCYAMDMSKDLIPMSVISDTPQGKISVEGKILNKFDMRPHNQSLEVYGKLCRERTNKYMVKNRQLQVIEDPIGAHMRPMPGMIIEKKKTRARGTDMKRTRRDHGEMEEIVFKLFERQPNWSLRNLIQETDQPEQFLKDILKDLCVYNNKGVNQGTYELKPENRKSGD